jgi:AP-4 complex subunit epsilon-1
VDLSVVEAYYSQMLQASNVLPGPREQEEAAQRLLEVVDLLYMDDGESYARHVRKILEVVEAAVNNAKPHLVQNAVEEVLSKIRTGKGYLLIMHILNSSVKANAGFRGGYIGVLAASLDADAATSEDTFGPTMVIILSAILCEYLDFSPSSPAHILRRLSSLLPAHSGMPISLVLRFLSAHTIHQLRFRIHCLSLCFAFPQVVMRFHTTCSEL